MEKAGLDSPTQVWLQGPGDGYLLTHLPSTSGCGTLGELPAPPCSIFLIRGSILCSRDQPRHISWFGKADTGQSQFLGNGSQTTHNVGIPHSFLFEAASQSNHRFLFSSSAWQGLKYSKILGTEHPHSPPAHPIMQMRLVRNGSQGQTSAKREVWAMRKSAQRNVSLF